jgi:hypothetical protein
MPDHDPAYLGTGDLSTGDPSTGDVTAGLAVAALSAVTAGTTVYRPVASFGDAIPAQVRIILESGCIPPEHLLVAFPDEPGNAGPDVTAAALAALGPPPARQPLFLVRSDPLRDPMVAPLARLVHESGWAGEDIGITHLEELGGTVIFDLLGWALPEAGGTVLICDEPLGIDARSGPGRFAATGLQLQRGPGPLQVTACGTGDSGPRPGTATVFAGPGPCDAWLALHAALRAGEIASGDDILLRAQAPARSGWLTLHAAEPSAVRLGGSGQAGIP